MVFLVVVAVVFGVLLLLAVGNDVYWRRRGFRTEIRGRGSTLTSARVPLQSDDEPGGDH